MAQVLRLPRLPHPHPLAHRLVADLAALEMLLGAMWALLPPMDRKGAVTSKSRLKVQAGWRMSKWGVSHLSAPEASSPELLMPPSFPVLATALERGSSCGLEPNALCAGVWPCQACQSEQPHVLANFLISCSAACQPNRVVTVPYHAGV